MRPRGELQQRLRAGRWTRGTAARSSRSHAPSAQPRGSSSRRRGFSRFVTGRVLLDQRAASGAGSSRHTREISPSSGPWKPWLRTTSSSSDLAARRPQMSSTIAISAPPEPLSDADVADAGRSTSVERVVQRLHRAEEAERVDLMSRSNRPYASSHRRRPASSVEARQSRAICSRHQASVSRASWRPVAGRARMRRHLHGDHRIAARRRREDHASRARARTARGRRPRPMVPGIAVADRARGTPSSSLSARRTSARSLPVGRRRRLRRPKCAHPVGDLARHAVADRHPHDAASGLRTPGAASPTLSVDQWSCGITRDLQRVPGLGGLHSGARHGHASLGLQRLLLHRALVGAYHSSWKGPWVPAPARPSSARR